MKRFGILVKVLPAVVVVLLLKLLAHSFGLEGISLNAIFSGIVGANVFLLGFLLSGVLSDYKESERLPGELAATILTIADELIAMDREKNHPAIKECLTMVGNMSANLHSWFFRDIKTQALLSELREGYAKFAALDGVILPNYIVRMKQEHGNIRRMLIRMHTIRDTNFVPSGYLIAVSTTVLILVGMILLQMEPFREGMFFTGVVGYVMVFLLFLIRDLDDPFDYTSSGSGEDVSLKPLEDAIQDLSAWRGSSAKREEDLSG